MDNTTLLIIIIVLLLLGGGCSPRGSWAVVRGDHATMFWWSKHNIGGRIGAL